MNRKLELRLTQEMLEKILEAKIILEESLTLLNYLIEKKAIKKSFEIENFKERIDSIKLLIYKISGDYINDKLVNKKLNNIKEVDEYEINQFIEESKKINNKKISLKYRNILKDNLSIFFDIIRNINIEAIAFQYGKNIYPIEELEDIYKFI